MVLHRMQASHVSMVKGPDGNDGIFKNTKIISMNGGFVSNAVCDTCNTVVPAESGLKEKLESAFAETKLQEYKVTEENGEISIYAKAFRHMPAHQLSE